MSDSNALTKIRRCDRNRKRSKRRGIYCPMHGCHLDSVSPKYPLYATTVAELREGGVARKAALVLIATQQTIPLTGQWLEEFWCPTCQTKTWYQVNKRNSTYEVKPAPRQLWQQTTRTFDLENHPGVGEFTFRHANRSDRKYYDRC